jgi:nucleoid DNA-binding protein
MDAALDTITRTLKKEGRYPFSGLGIFETGKGKNSG